MAQYDGAIRIVTKITTKDAEESLSSLEWQIKKSAKYMDELRSKMDALKGKKIPTQEFKELEEQVAKADKELERLTKLKNEGVLAEGFEKIEDKITKASSEFDSLYSRLSKLSEEGKAFTLGEETQEYLSYARQLRYEEEAIVKAGEKYKELSEKTPEALERKAEAQRRIEEQAERALQKENEQIQRQVEREAKLQEEAAEEERLAHIRESAVVNSQRIVEVIERRKQLLQEIADLEKAGIGNGYQQYDSAKHELSTLNQEIKDYSNSIEKTKASYKKLGDIARKSLSSVGNVLKKADSHVNSFGKRLKDIAHRILPTFHRETKRTNTVLGQFSTRLKSLLSGIFIFNAISAGFRKMFSGVGESFQNFYNYSSAFQHSVDGMRSSLAQLRNSIAAAFAPVVQAAIPYIQKLISYINKAVNAVAQLLAALMGKKTYTKALKADMGAVKDAADVSKDASDKTSGALDKVSDSADKAKDALEGYLSPLDEINKYNSGKDVEEVEADIKIPDSSDLKDDIGDSLGDAVETVFEELPIEEYWRNLADRLKNILSQFFTPIKEAWNREGKFVMDSWKYALGEVWGLIRSIGSDFLEVWQQEKTIKIFEDLLHIVGDIGLVVGNLAHNFRLAWEENETGKRILEGIRDIIGVIVANIRHAADATVEWSKNIDFSPLLTKVQGWIESLVPVFDNLSGIITDFYEKVLLPLGKWTLEKGLPELLQVFIDFNNKVDWEALRSRLAQFWEHLEPFAETVGEGLIIFIERCANALADFINSPAFDNFLTMIENWMDNVKPEDVADALEAIAKAIIGLKGAVLLFKAGSAAYKTLVSLISNLQALAAIGVIAATIYVGVQFSNDYKKWKESIEEYGWYEGRRKIAEANPANPYRNGTAITQEDGTGVFDQWMEKLREWQANNREAREAEKREQGQWLDDMAVRISDWWTNSVSPWFTAEKWTGLWEGVKTAFSTKWGELVEWWNSSALVAWWEESVSPWFTTEKWTELYDNIRQALVDKWNEITEWWSGTAIVGWWEEHVAPWFTAEKWLELFENIKTSLKEVWDNTVGQWASDISAWWDEHVAPWFTVEKWEDIINSVPEAFSSAFTKVVDTVKEKIQPLIDWVIEKVEWMKEKIQSVKEKFDSIQSRTRSFIGVGGGSILAGGSIFGKRSSFSLYASPSFASLSAAPIPALARGAVIPANKEFLAVLGDQKHGTNIEAPLDTIKQANRESFLELMVELGLRDRVGNSKGNTYNVKALAHSKVLFELMIEEGKMQQMATGDNPFLLGTT